MTEPYELLLDRVKGCADNTVQDAFRYSKHCQVMVGANSQSGDGDIQVAAPPQQGSLTSQEISPLLDKHCTGGVSYMMGTGAIILPPEPENKAVVLPQSKLVSFQEQDSTVSRAMYYVQRHQRPTKRERANESCSVVKLLKHWNKLTIRDALYIIVI